MARARSPEKRSAILSATVEEIAEAGLAAPTAKIAKRAGVAEGTLFTYFATKEELLNQLYLHLKTEGYARINTGYPHTASLKRRLWHVWSSYLDWAIEFPNKRKVSVQLNVSDMLTAGTRAKAAAERALVDSTLGELERRGTLRDLPPRFAAAMMSAMQEATMEFAARQPKQRQKLIENAFELFWQATK